MNFTHLAAFFSVAETGSVTAASERLHVSQPALTLNLRSAMTFMVNRPGIRSACAGRRGLQAIAWPHRVARPSNASALLLAVAVCRYKSHAVRAKQIAHQRQECSAAQIKLADIGRHRRSRIRCGYA